MHPDLQRIVEAIKTKQRFIVSSHERPDGDAIGSGMAAAYALRAMGKEAIVISAVVLLNAVMGYLQESRAESAVAALRQTAAARAHVIRDGEPRSGGIRARRTAASRAARAPRAHRRIHRADFPDGEQAAAGRPATALFIQLWSHRA